MNRPASDVDPSVRSAGVPRSAPAAVTASAASGPVSPRADGLPPPVGDFRYTRYASAVPPLDGGIEPGTHPVTIAGGGPVGMALALGLANHGVRSVILEADDTVCVGSRAACISRRSLEIVERLGALPAFMAKGLPWTGGRSFYKTEEVFRFEMPHDARQKLPPMINLEQYYIEHYLLEAIERRNAATPGLIDIRWGTELTGLAQDGEGVDLQARGPHGAYGLRARWLAACDGGQSFVRRTLGLELQGTGYEGRYVIIDIELPSRHPTERRAWFDPPWNPGSTVLMHRQPDDIWRIDYQLRAGQSTEEALQPEAVRDFVQRHLDAIGEGHLPWRTVWTSVYRAGAMSLTDYRHGRVLFAGNAAHAMPIFGVRGLNSGFDDADNLAWKLALVARGISSPTLLDSYSKERIAAFHVNAESAMRSTEFMSPPSRGFDLLREAVLSLAGAHRGIANLINPRQTEAVAYADSALSSPGDELSAGARPGEAMPEQLLRPANPGEPEHGGDLRGEDLRGTSGTSGTGVRHLSDLLQQPAFHLLLLNLRANDAALAGQIADAKQGPLPLVVRELPPGSADEAVFAALGAGKGEGAVYLLRPDGHVAARWRRPPEGALAQALRRAAAAVTAAISEEKAS